jgi:hypothetical protein
MRKKKRKALAITPTEECLQRFEEALEISNTGKDSKGNSYTDIGRLNQAAWAGERMGGLLLYIRNVSKTIEEVIEHLESYESASLNVVAKKLDRFRIKPESK